MKIITKREITEALKKVGLKKGDTVLVHSALSQIGRIEGEDKDFLENLYGAFRGAIGKEGTLVVPAFFYEYGREEIPYDAAKSPVSKQLGIFAQYVTGLPGVKRSLNPITALAAIGPKADYVCGGGTGSAYGIDSPWDRLLQMNAKMIFLGIDLRAMTFIHYIEQRVGVPHTYTKLHRAPVLKNGRPVKLSICSQVRYLDFGIEYDHEKNTAKFEKAGLVKKAKIGPGWVRCLNFKPLFDFAVEKVKKDPFYFLKREPEFIPGKIPADGGSGPERT